MKFKISPLDIDDERHIAALLKWENDDELYHFTVPKKKSSKREKYTLDTLRDMFKNNPSYASGISLISDGEDLVGHCSLMMNPKHLMKKEEETSWLGLTIGEKKYRGTGAATFAVEQFEKESLKKGATRIELGTFEYNHRAQVFFRKLGFNEIGRLKDFTYWDGKYWDDIRMEKYLIYDDL